jgi:hypothetical protein
MIGSYQAAAVTRGGAVRRASAVGTGLSALSLAVAGVLFVLYPLIRPFSDEASMRGAEAFDSSAWVVAHVLAMFGFVLLTLGLFGLYTLLPAASRPRTPALLLTWTGVGLTLPYYGAEVFGLHAVGQAAVAEQNVSLLSIANSIRWETGIYFILAGLAALSVGTVLFALAVWRSGTFLRWSAIPMATGFLLYIPQYGTPQPVRIAHGLLITLGCLLLAWSVLRRRDVRPALA